MVLQGTETGGEDEKVLEMEDDDGCVTVGI